MKKPALWIILTLLAVPIISIISWQAESAHAERLVRVNQEIERGNGLLRAIGRMKQSDWSRVPPQDRVFLGMAGAFKVAHEKKFQFTEIEPLREAGRFLLPEIERGMKDPANRDKNFHKIIVESAFKHEQRVMEILTQ